MSKTSIKSPTLILSDDAANELFTVCDFVRYGVSQFNKAGLFYGHGTDNATDEAIFMVLEALRLPIDSIDPYWNARLTETERHHLAALIHKRIETRAPAPYLLNKDRNPGSSAVPAQQSLYSGASFLCR